MLNIVHRDIKPIHIAYSRTFKKFVFIDFGCSDILDENVGELTETYYRGTIQYSS
jgi:hypothetical protein